MISSMTLRFSPSSPTYLSIRVTSADTPPPYPSISVVRTKLSQATHAHRHKEQGESSSLSLRRTFGAYVRKESIQR